MELNGAQANSLELLRSNLLEETHPYYSDEQLVTFLEATEWDVTLASYNALIAKAENDSITLPSGLQMPDNKDYWLKLAKSFRKHAGGIQKRGDGL